jgi:hypothetical protein
VSSRDPAQKEEGLFVLLVAATAVRKLDASGDDQEDWPRDVHEPNREDVHRAQKEIQSDEDDEPRHRLVMRALADLRRFLSMFMHVFFCHFTKIKKSLIFTKSTFIGA